MSKQCSNDLVNAEHLAQQFCNLVTPSVSVSFPSPTSSTSTGTVSTTSTSASVSPSKNTAAGVSAHDAFKGWFIVPTGLGLFCIVLGGIMPM